MHPYAYVLFCALLLLSNIEPIASKRPFGGGRHTYPKSGGGLSGGSYGHAPSGGLSGGGHGYPSPGQAHNYPSPGQAHNYPSPGQAHNYPSPGQAHGYPSPGQAHNYPTGQNHGYPSPGSNHGYPAGKGLSGNSPSNTAGGHSTNVHHHYHYNYNPPQQIRYTPTHGGPPVSYPVYRGSPPTYVYQYKDSGSKYGTLLAGLALLNLGTLGVSAYALSKSSSGQTYKPQPGEYCKFGVKKENGDYEETKIDCNLISSFIYQEEAKSQSGGSNSTIVTTTVTNVTTVIGNGEHPPAVNANPLYQMLPNGTLVPVNNTSLNTTADTLSNTAGMTSSVTTTTTNTTTVTNALDVKGKPIDVTPGMQCYVIRRSPITNMKKAVPCGLLQTYAEQSLKKNSALRNKPMISILSMVFAVIVAY